MSRLVDPYCLSRYGMDNSYSVRGILVTGYLENKIRPTHLSENMIDLLSP